MVERSLRRKPCTSNVTVTPLQGICRQQNKVPGPTLTFEYGKATTSWTKLSVLVTSGRGGCGEGVVDGGDGGRAVVAGDLDGGGVVAICKHGLVNISTHSNLLISHAKTDLARLGSGIHRGAHEGIGHRNTSQASIVMKMQESVTIAGASQNRM